MTERLSLRALNRALLVRQHLDARVDVGVVEAVERIGALQAQHPPSPALALWARVADLDLDTVDAAITSGALRKATLMRVTLHLVTASDHVRYRAAMDESLRRAGFHDKRWTEEGLTRDDGDRLLEETLERCAEPVAVSDLKGWLAERTGRPADPGVWRGIRMATPLLHVPSGGPWSFGGSRREVVAPPDDDPLVDEPTGLDHLVRRHLAAFGPATTQDVARFSLLKVSVVKRALAGLGDEAEILEGPDGETLFDLVGAPRPDDDHPAPVRLLPMWDSVLLAHADRRRIVSDEHRSVVIRQGGDVLPTVLVDGFVAGIWRTVDGGVEVATFRRLSGDEWSGVEAEAAALREVLADRDPHPFAAYDHWWSKAPTDLPRRVLS